MLSLRDQSTLLALVVLLAVASVAGCDNTIEPFDDQTGLYSVYGVLSLSESPDMIRVRDLNDPHFAHSDGLGAEVTLENLTAGQTLALRDTIITFEGQQTYNVFTETPIEPATTYRLTVERPDGATVQSTATTPAITDVVPSPVGGNCLATFRVTFQDIPNTRLVEAEVGFRYRESVYWQRLTPEATSSNSVQVSFHAESMLSQVIESQDEPWPPGLYQTRCGALDEEQFHFSFTHYGPDWLGVNLPINPLESWDVENGLGFFGGLREEYFTIPIDTSAVPVTDGA